LAKLSQSYLCYLHSPTWINKRGRILKRDKYLCQVCGKAGTHVHHLTYERLFEEADSDLITLCKTCHRHMDLVRKLLCHYGDTKRTYGAIRIATSYGYPDKIVNRVSLLRLKKELNTFKNKGVT